MLKVWEFIWLENLLEKKAEQEEDGKNSKLNNTSNLNNFIKNIAHKVNENVILMDKNIIDRNYKKEIIVKGQTDHGIRR